MQWYKVWYFNYASKIVFCHCQRDKLIFISFLDYLCVMHEGTRAIVSEKNKVAKHMKIRHHKIYKIKGL